MNEHELEEAIKHDLRALPTLKLSRLSAKEFYEPIAALIFKLSMIFLGVNTFVRIILFFMGLYHPIPIAPSVLFINLIFSGFSGLFIGFNLARPMLFGKMLKGQLKTGVFIKQKYEQFGRMFFLVYSGVYLIMTAFLDSGIGLDEYDRAKMGMIFIVFTTIFAQVFSLLVAMAATYFTALIELDRIGLASLINAIRDVVKEKQNQLKQLR